MDSLAVNVFHRRVQGSHEGVACIGWCGWAVLPCTPLASPDPLLGAGRQGEDELARALLPPDVTAPALNCEPLADVWPPPSCKYFPGGRRGRDGYFICGLLKKNSFPLSHV